MRFKTAFVVRDMETIQNLSRFAGQVFYLRRGAASDPSDLRTYEKAAVVDQPAFAAKVSRKRQELSDYRALSGSISPIKAKVK